MKAKQSLQISICSILLLSPTYKAHGEHFQGHVQVKVGQLSAQEKQGQSEFNTHCAECHGSNGAGTRKGPPLIHDIYNPGHHSNRSFFAAVRKGVTQHHWPYGDMPAQKQVGFAEMGQIVKFIRTVQEQNGIKKRAHTM